MDIIKQIEELWRDERKKTIASIWEAYKRTLNTPCNKPTEAEIEIGNLFMQFVLEISVEDGTIYYKTPYETFVF